MALRNTRAAVASAVALAAGPACAPRPAMCTRACDGSLVCASGECVRAGTIPAVEAHARLGDFQARRIVVAPTEIARLAPGDDAGETTETGVLGRRRDARAELLLRFAVELPPGTSIVEAHLLLDRSPAAADDPGPVVLHAARIVDRWDARSIRWGRAPRLEEGPFPLTTIDAPRREVRIDVRPIVRGWRTRWPDDQGIAIVADVSSATGTVFALADGAGTGDHAPPALPAHLPGNAPLFVATEGAETPTDSAPTHGPRLELYVKP